MEPTFQSYVEGAGAELKCPSCNSNALHHEKVEVFDREDDETEGLHVVVSDGKVTTDSNLAGNPSRRRNGLSISFWCEDCNVKPVMEIVQHKGSTFINFE